MQRSIVDVVILNYNKTEDTAQCIASVKNSSYPIRVIFLVDNSDNKDPNLKDLFIQDPIIRYIKTDKNLGFAGGNNLGIRESLRNKPDYILILNNDTVVKKDFLETLIDGATKREAHIATGKIYYYDNPDVIWGAGGWINWNRGMGQFYGNDQKNAELFDRTREVTFISGCIMLIKREVFETLGFFDERYFMYCEDVDFCLRALNAKLRLIYVPNSIIWHKVGALKIESDPIRFYYFVRNSILIIKKYANFLQKVGFFAYSSFYFTAKICISFTKEKLNLDAFRRGIMDGIRGK